MLLQLWIIACAFAVCVGADAPTDVQIFNGQNLKGWKGSPNYWRVEGQQLVGKTDKPLDHNEFLWSETSVRDFYLSVWIKLTPDDRNSGVQFRSSKVPPVEARGYQADIGKTYWGRLYHESGRGKLVWSDIGEKAVKQGQWNRCEILAVGHCVWIAINGTLAVAVEDPQGELEGHVALQIHGGPPQEVRFKEFKLIHNPKLDFAGLREAELISRLRKPDQPVSTRNNSK